jgi:hypothetical protein
MGWKDEKRWWALLWLLVFSGLLLTFGCQTKKNVTPVIPRDLNLNKVVVVGFLRALSPADEPGMFKNPLSWSIVPAEPVPPEIIQKMSDILFKKVAAEKGYELVSRNQAIGVYSNIVASDKNVGMTAIKVIQEVGTTFNADAVLVGYMYRWRERVGGDYAAQSPASVSFDLHLIRPVDGAILWKSKFDKTQQSLSENILDMNTFLKGGGKWMSVDDLAMIGLRKMFEEMP